MLHWSLIPEEDSGYTAIASDIEMSLFAVTKSRTRNRLISWPRVQNDAAPPPPYTSLPNPAMFGAIRMRGSAPGAFFLDISNMFHNITLPIWLARLLPMKAVAFSHLHEDTKRRIAERTTLPRNTADLHLRPCQATMGFKWAVFIAHTFVDSCFNESFRLLSASRLAFPNMHLGKLRGEDAPYTLEQRSPLLLHIIDDAIALTVDWPSDLINTWQRLTRKILCINRLQVAEAKSSQPAAVVRDCVSFTLEKLVRAEEVQIECLKETGGQLQSSKLNNRVQILPNQFLHNFSGFKINQNNLQIECNYVRNLFSG